MKLLLGIAPPPRNAQYHFALVTLSADDVRRVFTQRKAFKAAAGICDGLKKLTFDDKTCTFYALDESPETICAEDLEDLRLTPEQVEAFENSGLVVLPDDFEWPEDVIEDRTPDEIVIHVQENGVYWAAVDFDYEGDSAHETPLVGFDMLAAALGPFERLDVLGRNAGKDTP